MKANGAYLSTQGDDESISELLALAAEPASWSPLSEEGLNIMTAAPATAASHRCATTSRAADSTAAPPVDSTSKTDRSA